MTTAATASRERPRLAVVYDQGAAEPSRLVRSLGPSADLHFLVPRSAHARAALPFLEAHGSVHMLDRVLADPRRYATRLDGIVTFSERMLADTARAAELLDLRFHSTDVVRGLTSKAVQRRLLAHHQVDEVRQLEAPGPRELATALADIGLPAVVKPEVGEGSRHTWLVDSLPAMARLTRALAEDWPSVAGRPERLVVEEYLSAAPTSDARVGSYVSVESAVDGGCVTQLAVTGKFPLAPPFRERGHFWPAVLDAEQQSAVLSLTDRALRALDVRQGLCHTEIKLTAEGPRIIEVNGRLGGDIADIAERSCGLDVVRLAGDIALGVAEVRPPEPPAAVTFQYNHASPAAARTVVGIRGADAVRALEGVAEYFTWPLPHPVSPERSAPFDDIRGSARDHDEMHAVVSRAGALLTFEFTGGDTEVFERSGTELQ